MNKVVLVAVLKSKRDQKILLKQNWYRIPVAHLPKRTFQYITFYQPAVFGKHGKRIEYYAHISKKIVSKRIKLLPDEPNHPRAHDDYLRVDFKEVQKLTKPIRNIIPRRIVFGFTSLKTLLSARDILQLYGIPATESIVKKALQRQGMRVISEHTISTKGRRYRVDLVILCRKGRIAIECDNFKAHSSKIQKKKDAAKNRFLKSLGWHVIRLKEKDIIENLHSCITKISTLTKTLST